MPRRKANLDASVTPYPPPATTIEARENQMVALATDVAERQMRDGTASAQVIVHYLKMGTVQAQAERERLKLETELVKAKTVNLQSQRATDIDYKKVMDALRKYSGGAIGRDDDNEYQDIH